MKVLLDRDGDAALPTGYQLLQTEIEFLRYADVAQPLFIRGAALCDWAELFYRARDIPFQNLRSPVLELTAICPELGSQQAEEIYRLLGRTYAEMARPFSVQAVLEKLYPQRLWWDAPSWEHSAAWLNWLISSPFPEAIQPLLASLADQWRLQSNGHESQIYAVTRKKDARQLLLGWLGVIDTKMTFDGGEFPLPVPQAIVEQLRSDWKKQIVTTQGAEIRPLLARRMPRYLKIEATALAATYFKQHPALFTSQHLQEMRPYLDAKQQSELRSLLVPNVPGVMPTTPAEVLNWYRHRYLPYRIWQEKHGQENAREVIREAAEQFIYWYLDAYPKGLLAACRRKARFG